MSSTYQRRSRGPVSGRLDGKVAVIGGVGGGQGRAAALLFARSGAAVVGSDRKSEGLDETRELAAREGLRLQLSVVADLTDPEAAQHWIDEAAAKNRRLDVWEPLHTPPRKAA